MKREYSKPIFAVESFQVDASVAGSCNDAGYATLGHYIGSCKVDGGTYLFNFDHCSVDLTGPDDEDHDGADAMCYHGPGYSDVIYMVS